MATPISRTESLRAIGVNDVDVNLDRQGIAAANAFTKFRFALTSVGDWTSEPSKKRGTIAEHINNVYVEVSESECTSIFTKLIHDLMNKLPDHWTYMIPFLIIHGIVTAALGASMDLLMRRINKVHYRAIDFGDNSVPGWFLLQLFVWIIYTIGFLFFSVYLTRRLAPTAAGSGIPEMKSILSGVYLSEYLSFKTLVAKVIGIVFSVGSGIYLVWRVANWRLTCEGFTANQIARFPLFDRISKSSMLAQQMLAASCACGIAANLGAPIGGVLFSIEVTSTYYPLRNYWYAYVTAIVGAFVYRILWNLAIFEPLVRAIVIPNNGSYHIIELIAFAVLGFTCAILSLGFIQLTSLVRKGLTRLSSRWYIPYAYALIIAIITGLLSYPAMIGDFIGLESLSAMNDLLYPGELDHTGSLAADWGKYNKYGSLIAFFVCRYVLISVSLPLPIPSGLFLPVLAAGAGLGRFFGEATKDIFGSVIQSTVYPSVYATVGAATLMGSMTHAFSTAVILFEITDSIHSLLPVLIGIVTGIGTTKLLLSLSLYDKSAKDKGLPLLPDIHRENTTTCAGDIMEKDVVVLTPDLKLTEIQSALNYQEYKVFPVVDSKENMLLVGSLDREELEKVVEGGHSEEAIRRSRLEIELSTVDLQNENIPSNIIKIKSPPIQISEATPLYHVHVLFITLRLFHAFVTKSGRVTGVVSRSNLKKYIDEANAELTIMRE